MGYKRGVHLCITFMLNLSGGTWAFISLTIYLLDVRNVSLNKNTSLLRTSKFNLELFPSQVTISSSILSYVKGV